ncbi:hypothetical protein [Woeseia oceani]|uniref:Uncharacterized protein n=1 Tax=Woeseia oceani TaxID=1548547 RepID=A0A193LJN1_9GAMM|nr:hypothetical protein [Woeseia oceani]ANO52638.1 hypothetical protein BA177_16890 [Woeseia oceani]
MKKNILYSVVLLVALTSAYAVMRNSDFAIPTASASDEARSENRAQDDTPSAEHARANKND